MGDVNKGVRKMLLYGLLTGVLQSWTAVVSVSAVVLPDSTQSEPTFGMRLRQVPAESRQVHEPVVTMAAPTNEATMVRMPSGELRVFFINRPGDADKMMYIRSADGGLKWSEPIKAFDLPGTAYYANQVLVDKEGCLHAVFHLFDNGDNGYRGRHLDVWTTRQQPDNEWETPRKIYTGYVGSMRGFIQLASGRLLMSFARAVPARESKPQSGEVDYGWNEILTLYSDDLGETWDMSPDLLNVEVDPENVTRYGAIEPALVQLNDKRVWMLIRTNKGHLVESFSEDDGHSWSEGEETDWISSDSPAALLRLRDGRLVMLWCANQRHDDLRSYANGGRELLHAAISRDDGKSWSGYREVLGSPAGSSAKGDRGAAYPSAVENDEGKIVVISGQAEGASIFMLDPSWLEERHAVDDFSNGLVQWTGYGAAQALTCQALDETTNKALRLVALNGHAPSEAVWNFPMAEKGELVVDLWMTDATQGIVFGLSDHYSISGDTMAMAKAPLQVPIAGIETAGAHRVTITWDSKKGKASVRVGGARQQPLRFDRRAVVGLNYLRIGGNPSATYHITSVSSNAK